MTNTTPAPRPAAADVADDVYELTEYDVDVFERASLVTGHVSAEAGAALIADWRRLHAAEAAAYAMMMDIERERKALRAALPDPMMLHRVITAMERIESDPEIDALWDDLRNATYTVSAALKTAIAPAPVPAADVADVPGFLRARVNGGAR